MSSIRQKTTESKNEVISRNPEHYRPCGNHFFQEYQERGGKQESGGVEPWVITYLIQHGSIHHSKDDGRYVFKAKIPEENGEARRWWLPVQVMENEPNIITTCPYAKGIKDIDMKLLELRKPEEFN